ncbi:MAG: 3D domain-containing protein, partial [Eubacterium sp.]|nr:3D domain-containing protein [Eubacterium sp.]
VIPLGTKLYIETPDGSIVYGEAVAGDTGGAIKGNKIDLFMDSRSECMAFGRRKVNVYILN